MNDTKRRKLTGEKIKEGVSIFNKEVKEHVTKFKRRQSGVKSEVCCLYFIHFNNIIIIIIKLYSVRNVLLVI